jgi:hypothetical protein
MSDVQYFQGLYDAAKDFAMKAHWGARVRELNGGVLGACAHVRKTVVSEYSYGSTYYTAICPDCGHTRSMGRSDGW